MDVVWTVNVETLLVHSGTSQKCLLRIIATAVCDHCQWHSRAVVTGVVVCLAVRLRLWERSPQHKCENLLHLRMPLVSMTIGCSKLISYLAPFSYNTHIFYISSHIADTRKMNRQLQLATLTLQCITGKLRRRVWSEELDTHEVAGHQQFADIV